MIPKEKADRRAYSAQLAKGDADRTKRPYFRRKRILIKTNAISAIATALIETKK
jgi:hypothetical protein